MVCTTSTVLQYWQYIYTVYKISQVIWAISSAPNTVNAVQEHDARYEGITMVYMDHAVPVSGEIMPLCLVQ